MLKNKIKKQNLRTTKKKVTFLFLRNNKTNYEKYKLFLYIYAYQILFFCFVS